jgi:hypothetical protein
MLPAALRAPTRYFIKTPAVLFACGLPDTAVRTASPA